MIASSTPVPMLVGIGKWTSRGKRRTAAQRLTLPALAVLSSIPVKTMPCVGSRCRSGPGHPTSPSARCAKCRPTAPDGCRQRTGSGRATPLRFTNDHAAESQRCHGTGAARPHRACTLLAITAPRSTPTRDPASPPSSAVAVSQPISLRSSRAGSRRHCDDVLIMGGTGYPGWDLIRHRRPVAGTAAVHLPLLSTTPPDPPTRCPSSSSSPATSGHYALNRESPSNWCTTSFKLPGRVIATAILAVGLYWPVARLRNRSAVESGVDQFQLIPQATG